MGKTPASLFISALFVFSLGIIVGLILFPYAEEINLFHQPKALANTANEIFGTVAGSFDESTHPRSSEDSMSTSVGNQVDVPTSSLPEFPVDFDAIHAQETADEPPFPLDFTEDDVIAWAEDFSERNGRLFLPEGRRFYLFPFLIPESPEERRERLARKHKESERRRLMMMGGTAEQRAMFHEAIVNGEFDSASLFEVIRWQEAHGMDFWNTEGWANSENALIDLAEERLEAKRAAEQLAERDAK